MESAPDPSLTKLSFRVIALSLLCPFVLLGWWLILAFGLANSQALNDRVMWATPRQMHPPPLSWLVAMFPVVPYLVAAVYTIYKGSQRRNRLALVAGVLAFGACALCVFSGRIMALDTFDRWGI